MDFVLPIGLNGEIAVGRSNFDRGSARGRRSGRRHRSRGGRAQAKVAEAADLRLLFIQGTTLRTGSYQSSFCAAGALRDASILSAILAGTDSNTSDVANRTTLSFLHNPPLIGGILFGETRVMRKCARNRLRCQSESGMLG